MDKAGIDSLFIEGTRVSFDRLKRLATTHDPDALGALAKEAERRGDVDMLHWVAEHAGRHGNRETLRWIAKDAERRQDHVTLRRITRLFLYRGDRARVKINGQPTPLISDVDTLHDCLDIDPKLPRVLSAPLHVPLLWDCRRACLFACACAERVLTYYEQFCHDDPRPHRALVIAREAAQRRVSQLALIRAFNMADESMGFATIAPIRDAAAAWYAAQAVREAVSVVMYPRDTGTTRRAAQAAVVAMGEAAACVAHVGAKSNAQRAARRRERLWQHEHLLQVLLGEVGARPMPASNTMS